MLLPGPDVWRCSAVVQRIGLITRGSEVRSLPTPCLLPGPTEVCERSRGGPPVLLEAFFKRGAAGGKALKPLLDAGDAPPEPGPALVCGCEPAPQHLELSSELCNGGLQRRRFVCT
eukprot:XP_001710040.1 Hypothetical protein GL50803_20348 [Giardia lamblia ATCC 50803]